MATRVRRGRVLRLLPALLFLACASPEPERASPEPQQVRPPKLGLRFGWEPGFGGRVAVTTTRVKRVGDDVSEVVVRSSYRFSVVGDGDDLRIRHSEREVDIEGETEIADVDKFADLLSDLPPDLEVSRKGAFRGVVDDATYRDQLDAFASLQMPGDLMPLWREELPVRFSARALNPKAYDWWQALVGSWNGGLMVVGKTYTVEMTKAHLERPEYQMRFTSKVKVANVGTCMRGGRERVCADLQTELSDAADAKRVHDEMRRDPTIGASVPPGAEYSDIQLETRVRLVSEPDGLVPHVFRYTRIVRGVESLDGTKRSIRLETRTEYVFEYQGARLGPPTPSS